MGQQQDFLAQLMDLLLVQINTSAVVILSSREGVCLILARKIVIEWRFHVFRFTYPCRVYSLSLPATGKAP